MRRTSTFVFFASASFCTMLAAGPALSGEIRGRVLADDRPVPGVAVVAVPWETPFEEARREARREVLPSPIASVATGADGVFALSVNGGAPAREFRVRLEGGSIVTALVSGTFDAQETEDLGDLAVVKGARLAGRLETEQGTPVAGAEVLLFPSRGTGGGLEPTIQKTKSGPDGAFRFDLALPDRNEVSVRVDGLWIQPLSNVRTGAIASPMIARAAGSIVGTIRRSDRQTPAGGVLVRFETLGKTRWVETGADGSFVLKEVPAGTGTLLADGGDAGFAEILGARASANPVTANLTPGARLEGRVVNAVNGKPVPRAKVTALGPRGLLSTRSGADGRYLLRNFVPGRFQVRGDEPRYTPWEKSGVVVRAGEIRKLDLPLTPGVSISGKVVDETGAPVAGAKGSLSPATQTGIRSFLRGLAGQEETAFVSGSNGAFRASRLRSGDNLRLTVNHPSYEAGALAGLSLPPGTVRSGLTVVLRQGMVLSGIVKDEKQEGVPGAEVTLTQVRSFGNARGGMMLNLAGPMAGRPESEKTGGDGSFTFRGLSPGDYQLQVRRSGYATETVSPLKLVRGEAPKPVEVFLVPGAAIAGFVKLKDGTPLAGRIVMTRPPGGRGGLALSAGQQPTGPDGLFVLDGLKPGQSYDLLLIEPSAMPRVVRSGVSAPADGIELLLPAPGRITGNAIDAGSGKPVVDFQVWYDMDRSTGQGGGGQVIRMVARGAAQQLGIGGAGERVVVHAEDGSFALENVPPGNWEVNVEALGYQTARVGGITVPEGSERPGITVKVSPGATLTGKVVDSQSGRGIPNVLVSTAATGAPGAAMRIGLPQADDSGPTTDADGAFQMDGIAPGKYSITAKHPDYADGSETADVKVTGGTVKIALSPGSHISGLVADAGNQPLAGAQVALVAASDGGPMGRGGIASEGTTTDQSGSFRFDHLAAGRYTVTASLRNASSSQQQVVLAAGQSQDALVISLAAGATVQGIITGLAAGKRGNVLVSASGADGFANSVRSGVDGSFQISGAPEGILMLRATAGDILSSSQTKTAEVQIPSGQTQVNAEIAFDPAGATIAGSVTRGGQPVSGGAVMINGRGGAGLAYSGTVDGSGRYSIAGVQNGTYTVAYWDTASGGAGVSKSVTVSSDTTIDLDVPQGSIAGLVVEAGTSLPLANVMVSASPASTGAQATGGGLGGGGMGRNASTDTNGTFSLESLNPAAFNVVARLAGYLFDPKSVTLGGSETQQVTLEGRRSDGIGVQASDGLLGVPLRSLQARVQSGTGTVFVGGVTLDSNGHGEIPSVQPGTYTVVLDANGYAPAVLSPVNVPSQTLIVGLTPGGNVEIDAGAKTLAAGPVQSTLLTASGVPYPFTVFGQAGRLTLNFAVHLVQNIAPGSYTLTLDSGGSQSFMVQEGRTAVVTFP